MFILDENSTKEYIQKHHGMNLFWAFCGAYSEYDWLSPEYLLITMSQNQKLTTNKQLKLFLEKTFGHCGWKLKDHYAICINFENEHFLIWTNATGRGWHVETTCRDNHKHSRFCLKILQKCNFIYNSKNLGVSIKKGTEPAFIEDYVDLSTGKLKDSYFQNLQITQEEFTKKFQKHLRINL